MFFPPPRISSSSSSSLLSWYRRISTERLTRSPDRNRRDDCWLLIVDEASGLTVNKSLVCVTDMIAALADGAASHVHAYTHQPFPEARLTSAIRLFPGGNRRAKQLTSGFLVVCALRSSPALDAQRIPLQDGSRYSANSTITGWCYTNHLAGPFLWRIIAVFPPTFVSSLSNLFCLESVLTVDTCLHSVSWIAPADTLVVRCQLCELIVDHHL